MASIRIDGEIYNDVSVSTGGYLPMVEDGRKEWYLAWDYEHADDATLEYWTDMANRDPRELVCLIGEERIVDMWSRGTTLEDFVKDIPAEEQWASYDGNYSEVEPPTADERVRVGYGPRWLVTVTEPGGLSHTWEQTYESEDEGRDLCVSLHPDVEDLEELAEFVFGWDELVDELGHTPTVAFRHN